LFGVARPILDGQMTPVACDEVSPKEGAMSEGQRPAAFPADHLDAANDE
jgi:hypothetical protein